MSIILIVTGIILIIGSIAVLYQKSVTKAIIIMGIISLLATLCGLINRPGSNSIAAAWFLQTLKGW